MIKSRSSHDQVTIKSRSSHNKVKIKLQLTFFAFSNPPRRDVVVPLAEEDEDEQKRIPAAPFSTSNKGRKGYLPKKIRTSGDRISGSSSPGQQSFSDSGIPASPLPQVRFFTSQKI